MRGLGGLAMPSDKKASCKAELLSRGSIKLLRIDCEGCGQGGALEKSKTCLRTVVKKLAEDPEAQAVVLSRVVEREYRGASLEALKRLAKAYIGCKWVAEHLRGEGCGKCGGEREKELKRVGEELSGNPHQAYLKLLELKQELRARLKRGPSACRRCRRLFLERAIEPLLQELEALGFRRGKRRLRELLKPELKPRFLASRAELEPPPAGWELIDAYKLPGGEVKIYRSAQGLQHVYHLTPAELKLPQAKLGLMERALEQLLKLDLDPRLELDRGRVKRLSLELMPKLAEKQGLKLSKGELEALASSLARFTAGLGALEVLLSDPKVQDVYVDAPSSQCLVHLYHADHEECLTNLRLTPEEVEGLVSKFRLLSGRPLSEAEPVLDLNLPEFEVRATVIAPPLSPEGEAIAFRRHKSSPWTLPQFVHNRFLSPEGAGLLSLLVNSQSSLLIAGNRGAGKTSLLGALMLEVPSKFRIISIEDTLELPVEKLRALGFKVQSLRVQSPVGSREEVRAEEALRAALRLGESVLVIGEVRGEECKALYEAMRIGATGSSVLGTIHGASTRDVFDRVVYDLGVPPTSFKATDAVVVAASIRRGGKTSRVRRVVQVTEVRKEWRKDPSSEGGFRDLMVYDWARDELRPSSALESSQLLRRVASKWGVELGEVLEDWRMRSEVHRELVESSVKLGLPELLEAGFVARSNGVLQGLIEAQPSGGDRREVLRGWRRWLRGEVLKI